MLRNQLENNILNFVEIFGFDSTESIHACIDFYKEISYFDMGGVLKVFNTCVKFEPWEPNGELRIVNMQEPSLYRS